MEYFILIFVGLIIGVLGAILGIGGGVLLVPVLVFGFQVPVHNAVAVSLVAIIATSTQVASFGIRQGFTNVRLALFLELASAAEAIGSSRIAVHLDATCIERIFAITLIITAIVLLYRPQRAVPSVIQKTIGYFGGRFRDPADQQEISYRVQRLPLVSFFAMVAGGISGIAGTSGGVFKVPVMNIIGKMPIRAAAETSSFMIGFTALSGAIAYYRAGLVDPALVAPVVVGVALGSWVGNRIAIQVKSRWLERLLAIVLIVTAIKMIM